MPKNLFEMAKVDGETRNKELSVDGRDTSILMVGSKSAGKSILLNSFLGRTDPVKPTLSLEYFYARKKITSSFHASETPKSVCSIWDMQGGLGFSSLMDIPLRALNLTNLTIFIFLDLSQPKKLWVTTDALIKQIKAKLKAELSSNPDLAAKLDELTRSRLGLNENPDEKRMDPVEVPVVIIGGKYDIFQNFEPENKKLICRTLRHVAVWLGASLLFYSNSDQNLIKRAKEFLVHHAFGSPLSNLISQDYNKPLLIPAGTDSFRQIEPSGGEIGSSFELWKQAFAAVYPPEETDTLELPSNPATNDSFKESDIDLLRKQKDLVRFNIRVKLRCSSIFAFSLPRN
ncbi:unnamed protein product [Notodromas monacha]|uniref:Cytoplasmic dynein 2 light intermediate chain 1 n=1 Tax=Notodromas monacha TaxID=399045 RepID=A0A7R9GAY2_9CRUS|nr:unnamed protein product [Notodromas monacha]CAG0914511.1 unnamed protein product [Notodromas monacha]